MSHDLPAHQPFELTPDQLKQYLLQYATNPIYLDNDDWVNDDNPYRRQLRPQVLKYLDFDRVLPRQDILSYEGLAAQRLLTSIYEVDLMFLPKGSLEKRWDDFKSF